MNTSKQGAGMPRRAYSYARVSGNKQKRGDGIRRQQGKSEETGLSWPEIVCRKAGWVLDEELYTDIGRSAFKRKNLSPTAALTRFLKDIEQGLVAPGSVLLVENLDRLSRDKARNAQTLFNKILSGGVDIYTREPERLYTADDDDPMSLFEPIWLSILNHQDSQKKAFRAKDRWSEDRAKARENHQPHRASPPFWLRRAKERYDPIPAKVELYRELHRLAQEGKGIHAICQEMTGRGIPSPGRSPRWASMTVLKWLRTRAGLGEYQPHSFDAAGKRQPDGEPIPDFYPPVLDEACWAATQEAIRGRSRRRGRPPAFGVNILSGLAYQLGTETRLTILAEGTGSGPNRRQRRCLATTGPGGIRCPYDELIPKLLATVSQLTVEDVADPTPAARAQEAEIARLSSRVTALREKEERLKEQLADPEQDDEALLPVFKAVVEDRKKSAAERDRLKLNVTSDRSTALGNCQSLAALREGFQGNERNALDTRIQAVLGRVVLRVEIEERRISERKRWTRVVVRLVSGNAREFIMEPHGSQSKGGAPRPATCPPVT